MTTLTSCPRACRNLGRAPTTSASPPSLAKGTASEAVNSILRRMGSQPPGGTADFRAYLKYHAVILPATVPRRLFPDQEAPSPAAPPADGCSRTPRRQDGGAGW